ncbi:hypothetical protein GLGCALEP_03643 [Pseudomonas sp. MM221]|nr:hypothetical protein GLGCALEP_03643 [Pseudomonas sp. MM221]
MESVYCLRRSAAMLLCTACWFGTSAWAGGILIYEAGQEGNGLANAGSAALANDPSVLMSNPAGITRLKGTQISANAQVILGDLRFSRDSGNQFDGNEGGNALQYLPGTSLFISHRSTSVRPSASACTAILAWRWTTTMTGPAATSPRKPQ